MPIKSLLYTLYWFLVEEVFFHLFYIFCVFVSPLYISMCVKRWWNWLMLLTFFLNLENHEKVCSAIIVLYSSGIKLKLYICCHFSSLWFLICKQSITLTMFCHIKSVGNGNGSFADSRTSSWHILSYDRTKNCMAFSSCPSGTLLSSNPMSPRYWKNLPWAFRPENRIK